MDTSDSNRSPQVSTRHISAWCQKAERAAVKPRSRMHEVRDRGPHGPPFPALTIQSVTPLLSRSYLTLSDTGDDGRAHCDRECTQDRGGPAELVGE